MGQLIEIAGKAYMDIDLSKAIKRYIAGNESIENLTKEEKIAYMKNLWETNSLRILEIEDEEIDNKHKGKYIPVDLECVLRGIK